MQNFFTVLECSLYDRYNCEDWSNFLLSEIIRHVLTIFNLLSILQTFYLFFNLAMLLYDVPLYDEFTY